MTEDRGRVGDGLKVLMEDYHPNWIIVDYNLARVDDTFVRIIQSDTVVVGINSMASPVLDTPTKNDWDRVALPMAPEPRIPEISLPAVDGKILRAARRCGFEYFVTEADGRSYGVPTVLRNGEKIFPSLFLQVLASMSNVSVNESKIALGDKISIGPHVLPVDERGVFWLSRWYLPHEPDKRPDAHLDNILKHRHQQYEKLPAAALIYSSSNWRGGGSASALYPAEGGGQGLRLVANAVENARSGEPVMPMKRWQWPILVCFSLFAAFPFSLGRPFIGVSVNILNIGIITVGSVFLARAGYLFSPLEMVIGSAMSGLTALAIGSWWEQREKSRVRDRFGRYLSEGALRRLVLDGTDDIVRGRRCEITSLFIDLRGFDDIVRGLQPQQMTDFVGSLMESVTDVVFSHGATFDKMVSGSIFIFFGAPYPIPDHPRRAVTLGRDLLDKLRLFVRDHPEARTLSGSIGIQTGEVVVGNLGSVEYLNYTAIGDSVNLASRLSAWTRPWSMAIGPGAAEKIPDLDIPIEKVSLKNVAHPVAVRVIGQQ